MRVARKDDRFAVRPRLREPRRDLRDDGDGLFRAQRAVDKILLHVDNGKYLHIRASFFLSIAQMRADCTKKS